MSLSVTSSEHSGGMNQDPQSHEGILKKLHFQMLRL